MKKLQIAISLLSICFIFIGCPYESAVPVNHPTERINPKIIGTWEDSKNNETYKVSKLNELSYRIDQLEKDTTEKDKYHAHTSMVNGISFLNLKMVKPVDSIIKYSFYKMELKTNDTIKLIEVTENIDEQFSSSAKLKKFIADNMNNSYFFGKEELILVRSGK